MTEKELHEKKISELEIKMHVTELEFPTDGRRMATLKTNDKEFCENLSLTVDIGKTNGNKPVKIIDSIKLKQCAIATVKICESYLRGKEIKRSQLPRWIKKLNINDDAIAGICFGLRALFELEEGILK